LLGSLTRRQAAALVGVAPFSRDGGRMRGKRTAGGGRATLRACLYMAAVAAARGANPPIAAFYERLRRAIVRENARLLGSYPPAARQAAIKILRQLVDRAQGVARRT